VKTKESVKRMMNIGTPLLLLATFLLFLGLVPNPAAAKGSKESRALKCATKGDSKVSKGIAKGVVKHAIKRFDIADLVDEGTTKKARKEVYEFLKWKLGSPTAICGQYITAAQTHFNKGYSDEAAAALLGTQLPGDNSVEMKLPPRFTKVLQQAVNVQGAGAQAFLLATYGIPPMVSDLIIGKLTGAANKSIGRLGFNMPKKWDIDNKLVEGLIATKRTAIAEGVGKEEADEEKAIATGLAKEEADEEDEVDVEEEGEEETKKTKKTRR
jgi:hypothetical protein